jgi:hypothetical protein
MNLAQPVPLKVRRSAVFRGLLRSLHMKGENQTHECFRGKEGREEGRKTTSQAAETHTCLQFLLSCISTEEENSTNTQEVVWLKSANCLHASVNAL